MKEIIKLGLILLVIASVAAAGLGVVNSVTKGPIAEQKRIADVKARQEVMADADAFNTLEIAADAEIVLDVNEGTQAGTLIGYTIKTAPNGYAGTVEILVGIDVNGVVTGIAIGDHSETPGFGSKAEEPEFKNQYKDKTADMNLVVIKSGNASGEEIDSITGATITSRAVTDGVNAAITYYNSHLK